MLENTFYPILKDQSINLAKQLLDFITYFNLEICTFHGIEKRAVTMRDIQSFYNFFHNNI